MDRLTDVLQFLYKPYINIIVCGDFNLDSLKNATHISLYNLLSCYHCRPLVGWPTRVTATTSTIIDQVFINFDSNGCCCVLDNNISNNQIMIKLHLIALLVVKISRHLDIIWRRKVGCRFLVLPTSSKHSKVFIVVFCTILKSAFLNVGDL
nr:unnamed protein product [Callosobruchus chinensis]